jgi:signal transduction histidine kinase
MLSLEPSPDKCWMDGVVRDTGIGIPSDKIPQLFSEFYQVDNSFARREQGTGLGLALTKRILEFYRGRISVDSQLGLGSTFRFRLPLDLQLPGPADAAASGNSGLVELSPPHPGLSPGQGCF